MIRQSGSEWRSAALYYAIACGVSWILWMPLVLGHAGLRVLPFDPPLPVIISLGTLGPLIACFLTHRLCVGDWRAVRLFPRSPLQWLWILLGPGLVLASFFAVFPALISNEPIDNWRWHPGALSGILVPMFNYNLLGGPLFEEFGWRGFLQSRLQSVLPPWIAAIFVGGLWAAWHLPLFLVEGWSSSPPIVYLLIVVGISIVIAQGFNASGRAVAVAILMHSAFNASPRFLGEYLRGVSIRQHPAGEWLIAAAFFIVAGILVLGTRGRIGHATNC